MKKFTLLPLFLSAITGLYAQGPGFANLHNLDPYNPEFVAGEVLVKFRDEVPVNVRKLKGVQQTGLATVDTFILRHKIAVCEKVFANAKKRNDRKTMTAPDGQTREVPQLFNIYKFKTDSKSDVKSMVAELKKDPAVDFAEPNYLIYSLGSHSTTPNDPLYAQQPWLIAVNAPAAWDTTTGDSTQVIGIIDTGVDWTHPDLALNIWINTDEIPGNGIDDDNNGYMDDVRGWDFINHDNNPMDDNSHGTHVAGIAAARGNNGIGITGVAWNAKIMPVKMLQSSGAGAVADLAAAINYAANNGATVINMSLGTYAESYAVKAALENAYAGSESGNGCILVAAAGNDGNCICNDCDLCYSMFPACYSFVIGVQANGPGSGFSNYDPSGPVIFSNSDQQNYEISAPGVNILSTLPAGSYGVYSGTSMSTAIVSGAVALMKSYDPLQSTETLFCRLIQGSNNGSLDIYNSLNPVLTPQLQLLEISMTDTLPGCNHDGTPDAGENITFGLSVQNSGGWADSVYAFMHLQNPSDSAFVQVSDSMAILGNLSPYASGSMTDPFVIHISLNAPHHKKIPLHFTFSALNTNPSSFIDTLDIQSGAQLSGIIDTTLTLTPDKLWIVNQSFRINPTGVLILKPGTHLLLESGILNYGIMTGIGTPDSLIHITGPGGFGQNMVTFRHTEFNNTGFGLGSGEFTNCFFNSTMVSGGIFLIKESVFRNCYGAIRYQGLIEKCNFINCSGDLAQYWVGSLDYKYCNFSQIVDDGPYFYHYDGNRMVGNNFLTGPGQLVFSPPNGDVFYLSPQYWGTTDLSKIDEKIWDFFDHPAICIVRYLPILTKPSDSAHGVVWKVLINGTDPQDQHLDALGTGWTRFDVYFNRPMKTNYPPLVTFSAWPPYTQRTVSDSASWNADSTIWSAWYEITHETGDGINVIKVSGARDPEDWEVPPEFNNRFQFVIQAASASSVDFTATAGLNKVLLEWSPPTTPDLLGFNLYRYAKLNNVLIADTIRVNDLLITDTLYADLNLTAGTTYYYFYKVLGTDFIESDRSKIVSAKPGAVQEGDANGDQQVNVLDITTVIAWMINQQHQPFIFYAADVNNDNVINILDIIGIINIINGNKKSSGTGGSFGTAYIHLDTKSIGFKSEGQVAAMQFELTGHNLEGLRLLINQQDFEFATTKVDGKIMGIIYSFDNHVIPAGVIDLITLEGASASLSWGKIVAGDPDGNPVNVIKINDKHINANEGTLQAFPNPFTKATTIIYTLSETTHVELSVYDFLGRLVEILENMEKQPGRYQLDWNGSAVPPGIYHCRLTRTTKNGQNKLDEIKLVLIK